MKQRLREPARDPHVLDVVETEWSEKRGTFLRLSASPGTLEGHYSLGQLAIRQRVIAFIMIFKPNEMAPTSVSHPNDRVRG